MKPSWSISRRTLLRGFGVGMALPMLDAMTPLIGADPAPASRAATFAAPRFPVRMVMMNLPNGTYYQEWNPGPAGALGALKPMLEPLQPHTADLLLLTNLWNKSATADSIPHYANEGCLLTGTVVKKTEGTDVSVNGISMDQVAARCTGAVTRIPSLHLNMQKPVGGKDTGYARMYNNQLSWSSPTTPVPNETEPRRAFDRLFRTAGGPAAVRALSDRDRKSVLDYVLSDATALKGRVGLGDQRKLDEYLTAVRDVELQLERASAAASKERVIDPAMARATKEIAGALGNAGTVAGDSSFLANLGRDHTKRTRLMLDILALALWTDTTRVATFMFGNDRNNMNYSFIDGVKEDHHNLSHYGEGPDKLVQYRKICIWHSEQVAYLLGRMKTIKEANGASLLDNSMVFFGSALHDGNNHGKEDLPILLAGRGGGAIKPGRVIVNPKKTPLCNLYLAMLQTLGVQTEAFADSTRPLSEITTG
ncbi:hypothetical protein LBMAG53_03530 [Planctomycetota bacterium]|nr:hypothetical protein LBMAG53_03530 [Planctomycetota bacterium]